VSRALRGSALIVCVLWVTADLLTTVEFDETGDYLATGDRGGRVVIFERGDDIKQVRDAPGIVGACRNQGSGHGFGGGWDF
jgi:hypothetical protein